MSAPHRRFRLIVFALLLASALVTAPAIAAKGGKGGGKPPPDDPPPPADFDPVIATWGQHKHKGKLRDIIMVMDAFGETKQVVVDSATWLGGSARVPAWSPDGTRIAFVGGSLEENTHGYYVTEMVLDAQGAWTGEWYVPDLLVPLELFGFQSHTQLDWNPDDTQNQIVYPAKPQGEENTDLYITDFTMNDGLIASESSSKITDTPDLHEYSPSWSNDGSQIAYVERTDGSPSTYQLIIHDLPSGVSLSVALPSPLDNAASPAFLNLAWANENRVLAITEYYSEAIWCVDINDVDNDPTNDPDPITVFNLTEQSVGPLNDTGVSWIAGDTGIIFGDGENNLHVLEFNLPNGRCPTSENYAFTHTMMTDSRFIGADWWRNAP